MRNPIVSIEIFCSRLKKKFITQINIFMFE